MNIIDDTPYSLSTEYEQYEVGESVYIMFTAPYNSSLNLTIENKEAGISESFSSEINREASLFYIPKEPGVYNITAIISRLGRNNTLSTSFTAISALKCEILSVGKSHANETVDISAGVLGGYPPYKYSWILPNLTSDEQDVSYAFTDVGDHEVLLKVRDSRLAETECEKKITVVKETFWLKLAVIDDDKEWPLNDAKVTFGEYDYKTNKYGKLIVDDLVAGSYELLIEKEDYKEYRNIINISGSDETFSARMHMDKSHKLPEVEIVYPKANISIFEPELVVRYRVESDYELEFCKLLFNEVDLLGYRVKGSDSEPDTGDINSFTLNLRNGDFKFKVLCKNEYLEADSGEYIINVSGLIEPEPIDLEPEHDESDQEYDGPDENPVQENNDLGGDDGASDSGDDSLRSEIVELSEAVSSGLSMIGSANNDEKLVAEILGLFGKLKEYKRETDELLVRFDSLAGLKIAEDSKKQKYNEIKADMLDLKKEIPVSLYIISRNSYQSDPVLAEVNASCAEYVATRSVELSEKEFKKYVEDNLKNQKKIKVFTQLFYVQVEYSDSKRKDFSIVHRRVSTTGDNLSMFSLVENVPKNVAENIQDIEFLGQMNVINPDPVFGIEIRDDMEYSYYMNKKVLLDQLKQSSVVLVEEPMKYVGSITGFAIFDGLLEGASVYMFYIVLIMLVIGVNLFIYSKVYSKQEMSNYVSWWKEKVNDIRPRSDDDRYVYLMNKAMDSIRQGRARQSLPLFSKTMKSYSKASPSLRSETGEMLQLIGNEVDTLYIREQVEHVYYQLTQDNISKAMDHQIECENIFLGLPRRYQDRLREEYANMNAAVSVKMMTEETKKEAKQETFWDRVKKNNERLEN
jgi:PKD repeat protein